jgi:hypothetical protein
MTRRNTEGRLARRAATLGGRSEESGTAARRGRLRRVEGIDIDLSAGIL